MSSGGSPSLVFDATANKPSNDDAPHADDLLRYAAANLFTVVLLSRWDRWFDGRTNPFTTLRRTERSAACEG